MGSSSNSTFSHDPAAFQSRSRRHPTHHEKSNNTSFDVNISLQTTNSASALMRMQYHTHPTQQQPPLRRLLHTFPRGHHHRRSAVSEPPPPQQQDFRPRNSEPRQRQRRWLLHDLTLCPAMNTCYPFLIIIMILMKRSPILTLIKERKQDAYCTSSSIATKRLTLNH